ncbi:MAG: AAA family ATPase [bacterium]|nr:AAA family ATPase [bacterium]
MLERIHRVKGLGLLHDANGAPFSLRKASFIYADNGLGKSTLASLFRSCATNNPALIANRRTIDGVNDQEARLQFTNGQDSIFQNGSWDQQWPELLVFDADFVEQNVYSGGQVSADQRKNLLQFALGANAVVAQREYDQANEDLIQATATVRDLTSQLGVMHAGISLTTFQQITEVPDADDQTAALNEKIVEAENIGNIQAKVLPQQLILPVIDLDPFFEVIDISLANIDLAAEEKVKAHLEAKDQPRLEQWLSDGHAYGEEENCLFCNQPLEGVDLIQAYRSYFNQDYNQLKADVAKLSGVITSSCTKAVVDRLKASFDIACSAINGWQEHVGIQVPAFQEDVANLALTELRVCLEGLKQRKEANLLESIGTDDDKREARAKWQVILDTAENTNQAIQNAVQQITSYKNNLAAVDIATLRQQIVDLETAKRRYEPAVVDLFSQFATAQAAVATAQTAKQTKKDALNQIMQRTLTAYKDAINVLLRNFGVQFEIPNIDFHYRGGLRSDYVLQMRGANIALNGDVPDFRTSLSEGDKRTLAFAFFIASTEAVPDLANKIVVIDDPMCSLDLNRKQQTRTVLKRLHDNCQQLIVLAHDVHFLRNLRDDVLRTGQPHDVKCLKLKSVANRYSDFDDINIDQECETAYFKCHRVLDEYMAGNAASSMEVARSIRPMLEGYLHRRFPGLVHDGLLFGQVVDLINTARAPSPLVHAQNITNELNEINRYAGQFHHDTNPAADQVAIVGGELLNFVERAIKVVHAGAV